ncbi:GNAT family N-acetyltransferase [Streptomyces corynorhini]|uniref:GNAT family N-acetyltransferase n=1 Tax=Streptomyces corynorhini TaxID=2282652 RepID=A0A370BBL2_9ACTN|nr:GNAT family N-acetyltransferase [Streptomyces corynorhini]RDG37203.1 GNAT family N-acetyltransferase [Streptomyces corynorhini]
MSTPLSVPPIRALTMGDLMPCADLAEDRGWTREEHKWSLLLAAGTGYGIDDPDDPEGGRLAAVCVATPYGSRLTAVGMVLVARRHARQGLARRLMSHVLEEAGETPLMLYATPYGQPLYRQLGFTGIGEMERLSGLLRTPAPMPHVATRAATAADLPAIIRLDTEVSGVDRTAMLARLPAFADRLRVSGEGAALTGYAGLWPTPEADVVGPLIAQDTETAMALVASLAGSDRPLRLDIDSRHQELVGWGRAHGLTSGAPTTIMVRGLPDLPGDWKRRFAPLSMATG